MQKAPKQTTERSKNWKIWHSVNYLIGGICYLIGSILLYPVFSTNPNTGEISGWLYTIGSFTFVLADITEWIHYVQADCRFFSLAINFFTNVIGSFLYLVGSVFFIPQINKAEWGINIFIIASSFIIIAQSWKFIRAFSQPYKSSKQIYQENKSGLLVDFFAGIGALMYFSGSFILLNAGQNVNLLNIAATIYSLGGSFFFISGCFIQYRYFWENLNKQSLIQYDDLND